MSEQRSTAGLTQALGGFTTPRDTCPQDTSLSVSNVIETLGLPQNDAMRFIANHCGNSDVIRTVVNEAIASDISRKDASRRAMIEVVCPELCSAKLVNTLQACNGDIIIRGTGAADGLGHPLARAARRVDFHRVFRLEFAGLLSSNVKTLKTPNGGFYDVAICDIGGDVRPHVSMRHTNVHCCSPILDAADVGRYWTSELYIWVNDQLVQITS